MTIVRMAPGEGDGDDEMGPIIAVVLSNVYDISRMLSGECDRNCVEPGGKGHDSDRMIKVKMALMHNPFKIRLRRCCAHLHITQMVV
jgi:hypothetical protein